MTFVIGLALFLGMHLFASFARKARAALIGRLGGGGYKALYSFVSVAGLVLVYIGWADATASLVYEPPVWGRPITYVLMLIALVFVSAAYLPGGLLVGFVKHPMVLGIKLWAIAHLLSNGELRSVLLFVAMLFYAILTLVALKRRSETVKPVGPFLNDVMAFGVGLAAWLGIFFVLHPYIAGVALV